MTLLSPLHHHHEIAGAQFLEWGGWRLPAVYSSIADELCHVHTTAGYTDIPVLYFTVVRGPDALTTLQKLCTRNLERRGVGRATYTLVLNEAGAIIDDGVIYRMADDLFIVSVASRNTLLLPQLPSLLELKKPKQWLSPAPGARVCMQELGVILIAVQGPKSRELLRPAIDLTDLPFYAVREDRINDIPVIAARTGYSGELGFEFLVWPEYAPALWETIAELGAAHGAAPYGMQTVLTLGLEKGYLNALDYEYEGSTPLELGLSWAVDLDKPDFVGRSAVLRRRDEGIKTRLVGLEMAENGPAPVKGDQILVGGRPAGQITNAAHSSYLNLTVARAWLPCDMAISGTEVEVRTANAPIKARISDHYCWYDLQGLRLRA